MSRTRQEYLAAHPSDLLTVGDVRFREEPDEEEDEENNIDEGVGEEGDEDDDQDGGYSV